MSFFKNLFARKKLPASCPDPKDNELIEVFDGYGRKLNITRGDWRTKILPDNLKKHWQNPDELFQLMVMSLKDGFHKDIIAAAQHLYEIDPNIERGTSLWGIMLMKENCLDEAEMVLKKYSSQHGNSAAILTNLAKVYHEKGDAELSEKTLWHALETDPNFDNAFYWHIAIAQEKGGEKLYEETLKKIAGLPHSWRAQLWLARLALQKRESPAAIKFYEEALAVAQSPSAELLQQISGDLGNFGYLPELLKLTAPFYRAELHGLAVGNNLIKTYSDLGQIEKARALLNELYAQKRPDWKDTLDYWDHEISKDDLESQTPIPTDQVDLTMQAFASPLWLDNHSPAQELFPATGTASIEIAFLGCSIEYANNHPANTAHMSDMEGRMSRALPIWLAEQIQFGLSDARACTLTSRMSAHGGSFIVMGSKWENEQAARLARELPKPCDYLVLLHLKKMDETYQMELSVLRTIDTQCLATFEDEFSSEKMGVAVQSAANRLKQILVERLGLQPQVLPAAYQPCDLPQYLLRLEQLLAVRCASEENVSFLYTPRSIINGNMEFCLQYPRNPTLRILLLQTAKSLQKVHPEIAAEYAEKLSLLQRENPLSEPEQNIVQRILTI